MIIFDKVTKEYNNGVVAINNLSVKINAGDFIYLIGPSGAGKSTFLKLIYKEIVATSGVVAFNGKRVNKYKKRNVYKLRRKMGIVFQDFKLLEKKTIYENLAFVLETFGLAKTTIRKRVLEMLDQVGLKEKSKYYPNQLSGGEQQRIAIARALVNKPELLICDEPTGNLDPKTSEEILLLLEEINNKGTTIIMATHDKNIVNKFSHRVIAIEHGNIMFDEMGGEYYYDN